MNNIQREPLPTSKKNRQYRMPYVHIQMVKKKFLEFKNTNAAGKSGRGGVTYDVESR